ncbi:MAG: type IV toxin-antitoxin system AbiEi family antitoxin domain-containing protein [Fimbriiglobus sp.]
MKSLQSHLDSLLARGRAYFRKEQAMAELGISPEAFSAAALRLKQKGRLVSPRRGFFLILRPEDHSLGAPDPVEWIDPLMKYEGIDYRISLLRAAAFHGSAHQAAMVFQVIAPPAASHHRNRSPAD